MKQLILSSAFLLLAVSTQAVVHDVAVNSNNFSPNSITDVQVGDIIRFTQVGGSHTATSLSVPSGAATWDHVFSTGGTVFDYTVTVAGNYSYECRFHSGMTGSFSVTTLDIDQNENNPLLSVFPTSFDDYIIVNHPANTELKLVDVYGKVVASVDKSPRHSTTISTLNLDKGIYFLVFRTSTGAIETKKLMKAK